MLKLIVADDELQILSGIVAIIRSMKADADVCTAENGYEVLSLLDSGYRPDLIVTDIYMPGMDGITMINEIRRRKIDCDIAILSGFEDFQFAQQALRNNVMDYLLKPLDRGQLAELLQKVEDKKRESLEQSAVSMIREAMLYDIALDETLIDSNSVSALLPHPYFLVISVVFRHDGAPRPDPDAVMEALGDRGRVLCIESNQRNQMILLANLPAPPDASRLAGLSSALRQSGGGEFDFGVSGVSGAVSDLHRLYISSLQAAFCSTALPSGACAKAADAMESLVGFGRFFEMLDASGGRVGETALQLAKSSIQGRGDDLFYVRLVYIEIMSLITVYLNNSGVSFDKCCLFLKNLGGSLAEIDSADRMLEAVSREASQMEGMTSAAPTNNETVVNTIKKYIQDHYTNDISLDKVAELVHLHPNYVSSLYKRNTGMTFIQYVHHVRIDKAKEMILLDPDLAVDKAGVLTGYENPSHFFKVFKKLTGMTPGQFREKNRIPS
jgi:two-component system response regulator YesN